MTVVTTRTASVSAELRDGLVRALLRDGNTADGTTYTNSELGGNTDVKNRLRLHLAVNANRLLLHLPQPIADRISETAACEQTIELDGVVACCHIGVLDRDLLHLFRHFVALDLTRPILGCLLGGALRVGVG